MAYRLNALAALALWLATVPPAWAVLPETVTVRDAKDLQVLLEEVEDEALTRGAPKHVVAGCTAKLANFLEDNVLTTGRVVVVHPAGLLAVVVKWAAEGADRGAIANRLVDRQKAQRL